MRYAAVRCHPAARPDWQARAVAAGLSQMGRVGDTLLFGDAESTIRIENSRALIGWWHQRAGTPKLQGLPSQDEVLDLGWGAYLHLEAGDGLALLRDPSGAVPCFHLRRGTADLFLPDADTAASLGALDAATIDQGFLLHWLQYPHLRSARTGLTGIDELIPGVSRRQAGEGWIDRLRWNPAFFGRAQLPANMELAAARLREALLHSLEVQLAGKPLLLQLSGGLDSSIIAAALAERGIHFSAATFATNSPDGDERCYARAAAERCGATLEIVEEDAALPLSSHAALAFRPGPNLLLRAIDDAMEQARSRVPGRWLLDGGGGDNLFGYSTTAAPAADALRRGRIHPIADIAAHAFHNG